MQPTPFGAVPVAMSKCDGITKPAGETRACSAPGYTCDATVDVNPDGTVTNGSCGEDGSLACAPGYVAVSVTEDGKQGCQKDTLQCPTGQSSFYGPSVDDSEDKWRCCGGVHDDKCCPGGAPIGMVGETAGCCPVGHLVDECGQCYDPSDEDAVAQVWSAATGECCTSGEVGIDGLCCPDGTLRDDCGVCGGNDECITQVVGMAGVVGNPNVRRALQGTNSQAQVSPPSAVPTPPWAGPGPDAPRPTTLFRAPPPPPPSSTQPPLSPPSLAPQAIQEACSQLLGISPARCMVTSITEAPLTTGRRLFQDGVSTVSFKLNVRPARGAPPWPSGDEGRARGHVARSRPHLTRSPRPTHAPDARSLCPTPDA